MFGFSMNDEDFIKLSHFDRVRRGHYDKIPNILMLMGFTTGIHLFQSNFASNIPILLALSCLGLGMYIKRGFIEKDDKELVGIKREIEIEFQKREQEKKKGRKRE